MTAAQWIVLGTFLVVSLLIFVYFALTVPRGISGTIHNVIQTTVRDGRENVTLFAVHSGRKVHLVGLYGHLLDIHPGQEITFWPRTGTTFTKTVESTRNNESGIPVRLTSELEYTLIEKLKVLPRKAPKKVKVE